MSVAGAAESGSLVTSGVALRAGTIAAVLVVGGVHWQQYLAGISAVPTIGPLFLVNAIGAAAIALALAALDGRALALAALAGAGVSGASLISLAIAHFGTLFGYSEPDLRTAVLVTIVAELVALVLSVVLARRARLT